MPEEAHSPSWKELQEFIGNQNKENRDVIDRWFRLAASVIGILIVVTGVVFTIFGVKTMQDVKSIAERTAQDAATTKVKEVLQEDRIQRLVHETAKELFASGAYRKAIEEETAAQLNVAIPDEIQRVLPGRIAKALSESHLGPRIVSAKLGQDFRQQLRQIEKKTVQMIVCTNPEPTKYGRSLKAALEAAGLTVHFEPMPPPCHGPLGEIATVAPQGEDQKLKRVVDDLIQQSGGTPAALGSTGDLGQGVNLRVEIGPRVQ
jgi:hypothetical protein